MTIGGPFATLASFAQVAEDHGFDSIWTAETGATAFIQAAVVAQATTRTRIGTAIALAFPRSPAITAMTSLDLDELSGGRFTCGIGSQVKRVNEERFSTAFEHPAPKMREYALAMRAFIGAHFGEQPNFRGRFYQITMPAWPRPAPPSRRDIPIFFAAVNKRMQEVAGEVADGVIGHPMTSVEYINKIVLPNIAKGAEKAGREPGEVELAQQIIVSISNDRDQAKAEVKQQIGFYATTRTYGPVLELHGFDDLIPKFREAFAEKDLKKLASLVPDEMAEIYAVFGTPDEVREKVSRFEGSVGELTLGGPWYKVDPARLIENHRWLLSTFGR